MKKLPIDYVLEGIVYLLVIGAFLTGAFLWGRSAGIAKGATESHASMCEKVGGVPAGGACLKPNTQVLPRLDAVS